MRVLRRRVLRIERVLIRGRIQRRVRQSCIRDGEQRQRAQDTETATWEGSGSSRLHSAHFACLRPSSFVVDHHPTLA